MPQYDALILGSGQGGTPLSQSLAAAGWKTALIEATHVGGCCINEGCSPTKTMVASARVAYLAERASDFGVHVGPVQVDLAQVRERKRAIVTSFRSSGQKRLEETDNLDLIFGRAYFTGPKVVCVERLAGKIELSADTIVINTGCRPRPLQLPSGLPIVNSTSIMELDHVPEQLFVVGAGYISLEFAQMFRRFGSRVTLIVRGDCLLKREDPDISSAIFKIFKEDGIEVLLGSEIESAMPHEHGLKLVLKGRTDPLVGSVLLNATGRVPNTDSLHLEAAGVKTDRLGFVQVNEKLETGVPGIYALGDVKGGPAFTHISYDDYRLLKGNLLEDSQRTTQGRLVPYTLFIDPQLGRVGLSETEARAQGREIRVASMPMTYVARALETDESRGLIKAVVDRTNDQILGFAMLGVEGGEVMAVVETAMLGKLPYTALRDATFAHPTLAESLNNLFMGLS